jgi:hypothetical protein
MRSDRSATHASRDICVAVSNGPKVPRGVEPVAKLHASVYDRFAAKTVRHFYNDRPYRPANLAKHEKLSQYYGGSAAPLQAEAAAVPNSPAAAKAESV